jgi:hypothetical protein
MRYEFVNPLTEPDWNASVLKHREATVFHSAQWARVLAESYGYEPKYLRFIDGSMTIAIMPIMEVRSFWTGRRGVCLPFSDECAPLLANGSTMTDLIEVLQQITTNSSWDYLELRGGESISSAKRIDEFVGHQLALETSEESQTSRLRDSTRRNIQKAMRAGVEIQHLQTREAMDVFYALHCRTRRRHGLPPQPLRFFHLIHKYLIETGAGFVGLARYLDQWIAGAVFLQFGSEAVYKFGASDPAFQHLRANNLLMWEAIRRLQSGGIASRLSLGRSDRTDEGLLQFKRGWGGQEVDLPYYRIGLHTRPGLRQKQSVRSKGGVSHRIIQRLPISVLRLVGGLVYRHMG